MNKIERARKARERLAERSSSFWHEFREFALKGNMIDLAVGIIIGTSFNKLVQSLVDDIIMPPIGLLIGGVDFSELYINLSGDDYKTLADAVTAGAPVIKYGLFITNMIDFFILALTVFVVFKLIFSYQKNKEAAEVSKT